MKVLAASRLQAHTPPDEHSILLLHHSSNGCIFCTNRKSPFTQMGMLTFMVGQPLDMESSPNYDNKTQLLKDVIEKPIPPPLKNKNKNGPAFCPQIHKIKNPQNKGSYLHASFMHIFVAFCFLA